MLCPSSMNSVLSPSAEARHSNARRIFVSVIATRKERQSGSDRNCSSSDLAPLAIAATAVSDVSPRNASPSVVSPREKKSLDEKNPLSLLVARTDMSKVLLSGHLSGGPYSELV